MRSGNLGETSETFEFIIRNKVTQVGEPGVSAQIIGKSGEPFGTTLTDEVGWGLITLVPGSQAPFDLSYSKAGFHSFRLRIEPSFDPKVVYIRPEEATSTGATGATGEDAPVGDEGEGQKDKPSLLDEIPWAWVGGGLGALVGVFVILPMVFRGGGGGRSRRKAPRKRRLSRGRRR